MPRRLVQPSVLPGFGLTLGYTLLYLGLIVLLPLAALVTRAAGLGRWGFWSVVTEERVLAAFRVTFGCAFVGAAVNAVFGSIVAWTLVRYRFPGRALLDALVDLPFALPTAVSGIALTALYSPNGWVGRLLTPYGVQIAYTPWGIALALTFIGLPFVVRSMQPALEELEAEAEEAAASLGANRWQTFRRVIWPAVWPALVSGFALAFAAAGLAFAAGGFVAGAFAFAGVFFAVAAALPAALPAVLRRFALRCVGRAFGRWVSTSRSAMRPS